MTAPRFVVATVLCGSCVDDRRTRPGRLGTVERHTTGLIWRTDHTQRRPRIGPERRWTLPGEVVPPVVWLAHAGGTVDAFCRHHGLGSVSTADVVAARGNLALNFTATG